jgi:hypothetical protein
MIRHVWIGALSWLVIAGCAALPAVAPTPPAALPPVEGAVARGDTAFSLPRTPARVREAALNYEAAAQSPATAGEALWKAARAYGWLAQFDESGPVRQEQDAVRGINLARRAIEAAPTDAEAHYYLAVNLGLFSQLHAVLNHLPEMARAAEKAAKLKPRLDGAGPYRLLGSLYGFAPEPPISLGDEERGLDDLKRAVELAPEQPENHVQLAKLLAAMGDKEGARRQLKLALFLEADTQADTFETTAWQKEARRLWETIK